MKKVFFSFLLVVLAATYCSAQKLIKADGLVGNMRDPNRKVHREAEDSKSLQEKYTWILISEKCCDTIRCSWSQLGGPPYDLSNIDIDHSVVTTLFVKEEKGWKILRCFTVPFGYLQGNTAYKYLLKINGVQYKLVSSY